METQHVMLVGGSGFIGQHVADALALLGHKVSATRGSAVRDQEAGVRRQQSSCADSRPAPAVTWLPCDLRSPTAADSWPKDCQTVMFLAQAREHRDFPSCRQEVFAVNVAGLHHTLDYALRVKAQRFLYASTGSVYSSNSPVARETEPTQLSAERNYYVASKLAAEVLLGPFASLLPVIVLRLFMPYGMGQKPDMLFPRLLERVRTSKPIHLHGQEGLVANPVAVADVAEACVRCLALQESVTMNVAGPEVLTLREIGAAMGRAVGRQPVFHVEELGPPNIVGSTAHLRQVLNWAPPTRLDAGLRAWVRQEAYPLAG